MLPLLSKAVFAAGGFVDAHLILVGVVLAGLIGAVLAAASQPAGRPWLYGFGRMLPVVGDLLKARARSPPGRG